MKAPPGKTKAIFVLKNENLPMRKLLESEIQKILEHVSRTCLKTIDLAKSRDGWRERGEESEEYQ